MAVEKKPHGAVQGRECGGRVTLELDGRLCEADAARDSREDNRLLVLSRAVIIAGGAYQRPYLDLAGSKS